VILKAGNDKSSNTRLLTRVLPRRISPCLAFQWSDTKGPLETKWASRPGPVSTELDASWEPIGYSLDDTALVLSKIEAIAPGAEPKGLDIAVKFDGETDAWIWMPESYYGHKKPEYRLTEGTYKVRVRIESPGIDPVENEFVLQSKGTRAADLTLKPVK